MNYLGHWLFSDPTPDALIGSLWPDFGKRPSPDEVSEEFLVHFDRHQWLDKETDRTPILEPLRHELRPIFRKTTPIVVDMLIDHHLAKHWTDYSDLELHSFTILRCATAQQAQLDVDLIPDKLLKTLRWIAHRQVFISYQNPKQMTIALTRISSRLKFETPLTDNAEFALHVFGSYEDDIQNYIVRCIQAIK